MQLLYGCPLDDNPNTWYSATLQCTANRKANVTFHGIDRQLLPPNKAPLTLLTVCPTPLAAPLQQVSFPTKPDIGLVPMDVNAL